LPMHTLLAWLTPISPTEQCTFPSGESLISDPIRIRHESAAHFVIQGRSTPVNGTRGKCTGGQCPAIMFCTRCLVYHRVQRRVYSAGRPDIRRRLLRGLLPRCPQLHSPAPIHCLIMTTQCRPRSFDVPQWGAVHWGMGGARHVHLFFSRHLPYTSLCFPTRRLSATNATEKAF